MLDAAAVWAERDKARFPEGKRSLWSPCETDTRVLIKLVAHKTKELPPSALASGDGSADEADEAKAEE